jgi:hypothetical protein
MTWVELKKEFEKDCDCKPTKAPKSRITALKSVERNLEEHFPEIIKKPSVLLLLDREELKSMLGRYKTNGKLNTAEACVVNGLYKFVKKINN